MTTDQWDAQTAEIARLMDVADDEDAAIQQLEADVAAIRRVHAAKTALRAFTPSELREALDLRHKRAAGVGVVTAVVDARRVVSVPELQRAWRAVQAGKFRQESPAAAAKARCGSQSRRRGHQGTLSRSCRWLAVRPRRELRPSLSRWRAPPEAPRGFSNAGGTYLRSGSGQYGRTRPTSIGLATRDTRRCSTRKSWRPSDSCRRGAPSFRA